MSSWVANRQAELTSVQKRRQYVKDRLKRIKEQSAESLGIKVGQVYRVEEYSRRICDLGWKLMSVQRVTSIDDSWVTTAIIEGGHGCRKVMKQRASRLIERNGTRRAMLIDEAP